MLKKIKIFENLTAKKSPAGRRDFFLCHRNNSIPKVVQYVTLTANQETWQQCWRAKCQLNVADPMIPLGMSCTFKILSRAIFACPIWRMTSSLFSCNVEE